jgi:hypothetical protein
VGLTRSSRHAYLERRNANGNPRMAALIAQAFALFWTLVGVFVIIIGIGPRTVPDVVYHIAIVAVLIYGLVVASRASMRSGTTTSPQ